MFVPLKVAEFRAALLEGVRQAYIELKRRMATESLYGFSLCLNSLGQSVGGVYGLTEEKLNKTVINYISRGYSALGCDLRNLLQVNLRWSVEDAGIYVDEQYFAEADRVLSASFESDWETFYENGTTRVVYGTCLHVLQELDAEGLFGRGQDRNRLVLNLWLGDQGDEELLSWAQQLNGDDIYSRFKSELAVSREAWKQIQSPGARSEGASQR